ncbi:hypothetical protein, partial [Falsiroseomonas oryzae]|uniref:hypothetical protein n=1 Tax=Falsiroseomonas oryzae TaxID=2766473 RepID=UPI0022EABCD8
MPPVVPRRVVDALVLRAEAVFAPFERAVAFLVRLVLPFVVFRLPRVEVVADLARVLDADFVRLVAAVLPRAALDPARLRDPTAPAVLRPPAAVVLAAALRVVDALRAAAPRVPAPEDAALARVLALLRPPFAAAAVRPA